MGVAGTVDFPAHMKTVHQDWLDNTGSDSLSFSMDSLISAAGVSSGNPYYNKSAYDPYAQISSYMQYLNSFFSKVNTFVPSSTWTSAIDTATDKLDDVLLDDSYINDDVDAYSDVLDDQITNTILPRFEAGLSDLNAVMSSAYVLGSAHIEAMKTRDVAKYESELRAKMNIQRNDAIVKAGESILQTTVASIELFRVLVHYGIEANRISMVANKEKSDQNMAIGVGEARWPFEVFMYGANLLASIGGGTYIPNQSTASPPSSGQSMLSGALSGASFGAQIGGSEGAFFGSLLGIGASLLF